MVDRWLIPLRVITASDYQTSDHILSTCEMKRVKWLKTVVGLIRLWPPLRLISSRPFVGRITGCLCLCCFVKKKKKKKKKCHKICLFSEGGWKYPGSIYKQQTDSGVVCAYNYTPPFPRSPFVHCEIPHSVWQSPNTKPGTEQKNVNDFQPNFALKSM